MYGFIGANIFIGQTLKCEGQSKEKLKMWPFQREGQKLLTD
jgi:hypothetical protein